MSKGSKPRNNHSVQFRDNYDNISWIEKSKRKSSTARSERDVERHQVSSDILMGCIRQSNEAPLNKDEGSSCA